LVPAGVTFDILELTFGEFTLVHRYNVLWLWLALVATAEWLIVYWILVALRDNEVMAAGVCGHTGGFMSTETDDRVPPLSSAPLPLMSIELLVTFDIPSLVSNLAKLLTFSVYLTICIVARILLDFTLFPLSSALAASLLVACCYILQEAEIDE
jgi:hypothetical protein